MRRLDRYVLNALVRPFLFFVLVFTGIIWLGQSLRVIDTVVNNGQSATVFLEFTILLLPLVLSIVIPIAAFAATLYAINRLYTDSEVVVMFAAGLSGLSLLRPVAIFSAGLMIVTFAITLIAMPTAQREFRERVSEIRGDVAAAFLREGAFLSPAKGVTDYLRDVGDFGEMLGIFVHDERDPDQIVTYTAERAVLIDAEGGTRLVMFDGIAQTAQGPRSDALSVLRFKRFDYDLSRFEGGGGSRLRKPSELYVDRLLTITRAEAEERRRSLGEFRAEGHEALAAPLYVLTLPLIAVAFVIAAGFRRQGFLGRIVAAVVAGLLLRLLGFAAKGLTTGTAEVWPLMYAPPILGVILAVSLLIRTGRGQVRDGPAEGAPA